MNINKKLLIKISIVLATVAVVAILVLKIYDYVQNTLAPTQVEIVVLYSPKSHCRVDSPLYVAITNNSHRTVNKSAFTLTAKNDSSEENMIPILSSTYNKDKIIRSGETYEGCWPYPKLKSNKYAAEELTFEVKRKVITF